MSDRVDTEALAAVLTEAEKETLWEAIERAFLDTTTFNKASEDDIEHTVEAILAARDARVRADALDEAADRMPAFHDRDVPEWAITSACKWLRVRAAALRAALPAASSVGSGVGEGTP